MRGINKVILIGNTGRDPEYKVLQDGISVAKIALATTESYRQKNGEWQTKTEWHSVIVWRGLATFVNQYVHKGSLLYIEGKLRNRSYEGKEGQKRFITEIVADQVLLMDKKEKVNPLGAEDGSDGPIPF